MRMYTKLVLGEKDIYKIIKVKHKMWHHDTRTVQSIVKYSRISDRRVDRVKAEQGLKIFDNLKWAQKAKKKGTKR